MKNWIKQYIRLPRVYVCRDVILIIWGEYEWIIKRWFTDDRRY